MSLDNCDIITNRCIVNCDSSKLPTDLLPGGHGFQELLNKDLVMNIYKNGQLGSFRHQHLPNGNYLLFCLCTMAAKEDIL